MSTFFGLTIAESGLRVYQAATNTTGNNIANVNTKGYSKQVLNTSASSSIRSYTSWGTISTGVTADSVTQLRSKYYDSKYWQYKGYESEYDQKLSYMSQVENYFRDDSTVKGFETIYNKMFASLDTLKTSPADTAVRNQFISDAKNLTSYFNTVATGLQDIQKDINEQVKSTVDQVNSIVQKVVLLNDQINSVEISGSYANELRDSRALLVDELSTMVGVQTKETKVYNSNNPDMFTGATNFEVKINGMTIIDGNNFRELKCVARDRKLSQNDADGLYEIRWTDTNELFSATNNDSAGTLKGLYEMMDGNNNEVFSGTVRRVSGTAVTISYPSITNENAMTMPERGPITIGNRDYTYSGFSMRTTNSGETEYTFYIDSDLNGLASMEGKGAQIGVKVDYKGIPYYQTQLNEFLRAFTKAFNDIQRTGVDMNGNPMGAFFISRDQDGKELDFYDEGDGHFRSNKNTYYRMTALNVNVAKASTDDPAILSTAVKEKYLNGIEDEEMTASLLKLQNEVKLYRGSGGGRFLQYMTSDVTIDTEQATMLAKNYETISGTVNQLRTSVSGVDEDEEALDLLKFKNAYELCAKVMQTMTEMYDKLINQTGV